MKQKKQRRDASGYFCKKMAWSRKMCRNFDLFPRLMPEQPVPWFSPFLGNSQSFLRKQHIFTSKNKIYIEKLGLQGKWEKSTWGPGVELLEVPGGPSRRMVGNMGSHWDSTAVKYVLFCSTLTKIDLKRHLNKEQIRTIFFASDWIPLQR